VKGTVEVRPLGNIADVKVAPESQDALLTGDGFGKDAADGN
jgi:hypothetical protein